jgi:hypothetical protein
MGRDAASVGQELTGVIEEHHAIAEETPSLLGVEGDQVGRLTVGGGGGRARRLVLAHDSFPWSSLRIDGTFLTTFSESRVRVLVEHGENPRIGTHSALRR